jgi:hypothetical protein
MIHTLGSFYSIRTATNAYQGKVMGFIGYQRATKEPTPVCMPQVTNYTQLRVYLAMVGKQKKSR